MSVIKSKRNQSTIQFLDTARELEVFTLKQASRFPKRYMFLITKDIVDISKEIYNNAKSANTIIPEDKAEYLMRKDYINKAMCGTQCLISQLTIARDIIKHSENNQKIESTMWQTWAKLTSEEYRMLKALKKTAKERYKDLAD